MPPRTPGEHPVSQVDPTPRCFPGRQSDEGAPRNRDHPTATHPRTCRPDSAPRNRPVGCGTRWPTSFGRWAAATRGQRDLLRGGGLAQLGPAARFGLATNR
jgi:hypothetical protein